MYIFNLLQAINTNMNDIRQLISIVEGRRNPDLNLKKTISARFNEIIEELGTDGVYVHYNNIEKVGIHPRSYNLFGPMGVYGMPIDMAKGYLLYAQKHNLKYANIILAKPGIKILNLDTITLDEMKKFLEIARSYSKLKDRSIPIDVKSCWRTIIDLLDRYSKIRTKNNFAVQNFFFRKKCGFDAILDNSLIINDNPGQIVFLTPGSYIVKETVPLRFN